MKSRYSIGLLILIGLASCSTLNKSALLINLEKNQSKTDLSSNGILAVRTEVVANNQIELLLTNENGSNYTVLLNPSLSNNIGLYIGPVKIADKDLPKKQIKNDMFLFELPPGSYETQYIIVKSGGSNFPKKITKRLIDIEPGKISYIGSYSIESKMLWIFTTKFEIHSLAPKTLNEETLNIEGVGKFDIINFPDSIIR
ncbi:hypothetical protein [Sediminispirochaeta bajacaliforniensis]|uniref:hypothetical protein n=1 Tax=Sediminispirochaeta bajacaliforniensis TaxID=148 RepID=UPI00036F9C73|nr:hypothetical protein [Sediminispirochaeta bajacaliforniensis]